MDNAKITMPLSEYEQITAKISELEAELKSVINDNDRLINGDLIIDEYRKQNTELYKLKCELNNIRGTFRPKHKFSFWGFNNG